MTPEATMEKLNAMKLFGMATAYAATLEHTGEPLTSDELIAHVVDAEWEHRHTGRLNRLVRSAKFRYQASLEQINFRLERSIDKGQITRFGSCEWIRRRQNIIITGPTGVGKSFIACALGHQACLYGFRVAYFNGIRLFELLKLKRADGTYVRELKRLQRHDLLIIDDFGLEHFDRPGRLALLELLEDRYGIRSTLITSQLPVKNWHEVIADPTIADSICDRLVHNAHILLLMGGSVRKMFAEKLE